MPNIYSGRIDWMALRDKIRAQATRNALTLTLMSIGFILTWAFILAATLWAVAHGN